ncbi:hypothetical protein BDY21DRAFT_368208 [Lineolata rhizophorae]|uniref:Uncharacterized protein n=1 Tax=Lineolata rhizophorae TaxID=578093 RepID=A0A6A6PE26_9PEZI|nr:hypothetical protein BDY21DRAFT_368208 [Lineolata rhizophorae]
MLNSRDTSPRARHRTHRPHHHHHHHAPPTPDIFALSTVDPIPPAVRAIALGEKPEGDAVARTKTTTTTTTTTTLRRQRRDGEKADCSLGKQEGVEEEGEEEEDAVPTEPLPQPDVEAQQKHLDEWLSPSASPASDLAYAPSAPPPCPSPAVPLVALALVLPRRLRLWYYRYEVTLGPYVMTAAEKAVLNGLLVASAALLLYAAAVYLPGTAWRLGQRLGYYLVGSGGAVGGGEAGDGSVGVGGGLGGSGVGAVVGSVEL